MVAAAVVYGALVYWAVTADTGLAWTILTIASFAIVIVAFLLLLRRSPPELPVARAVSPGDGVYRLLVIVEGAGSAAAVRDHLEAAAAGRSAEAFVVVPTLSSRLDWLTGDQDAYDRASTELDATLAGLATAGIQARGHIAAHDPIQAAADGLREFPADAILVITSAGETAAAAEPDVAESLRTSTTLPVTQVTAAGPA